MSEEEVVTKDIGLADQLTMDDFIRTLIAQMFENDNDTAELEVVLKGSEGQEPPRLMLQLKLTSINGQATEGDSNGDG